MIFGSNHIKIQRLFLGLSIVIFGVEAASAQTHPQFELRGFWIVDEAQSDSIQDKLSGLRDRPKTGLHIGRGALSHGRFGGGGSGPRGPGSSRKDQPFGKLFLIMAARAIHIDGYGEVVLTYDGKATRYLAPNPAGRVFSASGSELVGDEFGQSLSYWEANDLIVETATARGAQLVERYKSTAAGNGLVVSVSFESSRRGAPAIDAGFRTQRQLEVRVTIDSR